ncbi:unnamed protein product [Ixodes hexagonus]
MPTEWREAQFPVPYGNLAAKLWGDPFVANTNVLALHGWRNNAGTFDTLIPLLSTDLYVVAVDLPGHGLSSHRPAGCSYSYHEYVMDVCRLVNHLGWRSFAILGHSFGCTIGTMYACLFPDRVSTIVAIEMHTPLHQPDDMLAQETAECYEGHLRLEAKLGNAPVYTEEELLRQLDEATLHALAADSMWILLKRETVSSGSGTFRVTTDPRTNVVSTIKLTRNYQSILMERFRGDLLLLTASQPDERAMRESIPQFFEIYRRCCRRFEHIEVEGNHYVHLNEPEKVAPLVNAFLGLPNGVSL